MKKVNKIVSIVMIAMMLLTVVSNTCFALDPSQLDGSGASTDAEDKMASIANGIIGPLKALGVIVGVIVLIVIGIKYLMGSASEKAEYKKTFIPYLVGAILVMAAPFIADAIFKFAGGIQ